MILSLKKIKSDKINYNISNSFRVALLAPFLTPHKSSFSRNNPLKIFKNYTTLIASTLILQITLIGGEFIDYIIKYQVSI